jgi:zinc transport system permease protein
MLEIFSYDFMIRAFVAGIAISIIAPLVGTFLVVKKFSLIADTLSHVALAGVAVGILTSTSPLITTLIVTVAASIAIEYIRTKKSISGDAILAMFLPGGLAFALVLLGFAKGINANLFAFLFGSISTVGISDMWLIGSLAVVTVATISYFYSELFYVSFDEESAKVSGIPVASINTLLVILTAVCVSLSMRIVGILLIGALTVIPVTTAMQIAHSFKESIFLSVLFALTSVVVGLFLSFYLSLPAGGVIVLCSLFLFVISSFTRSYR